MLHITLTTKTLANDPADPLRRTFYGWGQQDSIEENWGNNRGYWVLGARAHRESYVLFSHNGRHEVVMAARIDNIIDAPGKPGRKIIEGEPLPKDHPVHQAYVGQPTPDSARVRNPVTYFDSTVGGWLCGCGCGEEIFAGEFVRGHEQTALHQRVPSDRHHPRVPALVRRRSSWCRVGGTCPRPDKANRQVRPLNRRGRQCPHPLHPNWSAGN